MFVVFGGPERTCLLYLMYVYSTLSPVVEEVFRSFTSVKAAISHDENTRIIHVKVISANFHLGKKLVLSANCT